VNHTNMKVPEASVACKTLPECIQHPAQPTGQYQGHQVRLRPEPPDINTAEATVLLSRPPEHLAPQGSAEREALQLLPDLSKQDLEINRLSPTFVPLEKRVPKPPSTPDLECDYALAERFQEVEYLTIFKEQLAERRSLEAQDKEFFFDPLNVTLRNMETFIDHIRQNKQFEHPLTQEENAALTRLGEQTKALVKKQQAPYKRTVRLALSLMLLCDLIVQRQVIQPIFKNNARLIDDILYQPLFRSAQERLNLLRALPLMGQQTPGTDAIGAARIAGLDNAFFAKLDDQQLLLYPSFHPLSIRDFCRFGHLPLHPLGLMTDYVLPADGILRTPLAFVWHDEDHMADLTRVAYREYPLPSTAASALCNCEQRLDWRCLLLDRVPACLASRLSQPGLQLLLFIMFHENSPEICVTSIEGAFSPFLYFLEILVAARTSKRNHYEDIYTKITTDQAAMTALWAMRLWLRWQEASFVSLSERQLQDCLTSFVDEDVPRLLQHLRFFAQYRGRLRQALLEDCTQYGQSSNKVTLLGRFGPHKELRYVFKTYDSDTGLRNMETAEEPYFHLLCCAAQRQAMEDRLGIKLPQGTASDPDSPQPAPLQTMKTS